MAGERKFKTGDLVILLSDLVEQHPMTVRDYVADLEDSILLTQDQIDGIVICDWRDVGSKPHQKTYKEDELRLI